MSEKRVTQIRGRFGPPNLIKSSHRQQLANDSPLKRFPINRDNGSIKQIKDRELAREDKGDKSAHGTYYPIHSCNPASVE